MKGTRGQYSRVAAGWHVALSSTPTGALLLHRRHSAKSSMSSFLPAAGDGGSRGRVAVERRRDREEPMAEQAHEAESVAVTELPRAATQQVAEGGTASTAGRALGVDVE